MAEDWINKLYFGDNLDIMREHIADESVDLIYLDPPFNSKATYNVLFQEKNGTESGAQIEAFSDTWKWGYESEQAYREIVTKGKGPKKLADLIQAMRSFLGTNDMMAYLVMMAIRLVEMHRVLKQTGSIYLHCDPTASHYLKLVMDSIFDFRNYINEIVWRRYKRPKGSQHAARRFGMSTDTIFFYSKSDDYKFFINKIATPLDEKEILTRYTLSDEKGPYYSGPLLRSSSMGERPNLVYEHNGFTPGPEGWRMTKEKLTELDMQGDIFWTKSGTPRRKVRIQDEPGKLIDNLWTDIEALGAQAGERLGYPTQKPEALLERIIKASSKEGGIVLDPFCGCGTTIAVAERLGRKWIGIDITNLAVTLMKSRLEDAFGHDLSPYEVIGDPKDLPGARALAEQGTDGRYQFEWWALGKIGARPAQDKKKGADKGIDGYLYFIDDESGIAKKIIVQVKSGHVKLDYIHALKGIIEGEKAVIGAFITLQEPTKPMKAEAAATGFYEPKLLPGKTYPKIQILTIEEILNGKQLEYPRVAPEVTFKRAERKNKGEEPEQGQLF